MGQPLSSATAPYGLVQQAILELGASAMPSTVVGNTSADVVQMLALINACGFEITREFDWQALTIEYRFTTQFLATTGTWTTSAATVTGIPTTAALSAGNWQALGEGINQDTYILSVDGATQVTLTQTPSASGTAADITFCQTKYAMPSGYDRFVDNTQWDKTQHWQMLGPETQQQVQWLKSGFISTGPRVRYYLLGDKFQIWPPLSTNEYLGFDYVSNFWVTATGGTAPTKNGFTEDTDTCIFNDRLMVLALKKKWMEIKGFDTTAVYRDYRAQLDIAKANDAGSPTLAMAPTPTQILITHDNIPDAGYGS